MSEAGHVQSERTQAQTRAEHSGRRWRRIGTGAAGIVLALGIAGCSAAGTTTLTSGGYWLIKVSGSNGNIYIYPPSDRPAAGVSAAYLGGSQADVNRYADQAATSLGITHVDSGFY